MRHMSRYIPAVRAALVALGGLAFTLQAQNQTITEDFPYFGKIQLQKVGDEEYTSKVEDVSIGPINLSQGKARSKEGEASIHFDNVDFLGKTFTVTFNKKMAPLTSALKGKRVLVGKIEGKESVELLGVTLDSAQIAINEATEQLLLEGRFNKFGLTFIGQFIASKQTNTLTFDAALEATPDEYKPFAELAWDAPDALKDIRLTNVTAGVQAGVKITESGEVEQEDGGQDTDQDTQQKGKQKTGQLFGVLYIKGTVKDVPFVEQPLEARVSFGYKGGPQASISVGLPEGWKLSNLLPDGMKKTDAAEVMDAFQIKTAMFVATSQEELFLNDVYFERGFNLYAKIGLPEQGKNRVTDLVRNIYSELNLPLTQNLELFGNFDPAAGKFSLDALAGFEGLKFKIGKILFDEWKLGAKFSVSPKKASMSLVGQGDMTPPNQDRPVTFSGGFDLETPSQVGGHLSMVHTWKDPFGIKGVSVSDLSVAGKQSITQVSSTAGLGALIPAEMGMTGTASIDFAEDAQSKGTFTLQWGTDGTDWAFDIDIEDAPNFPEIASFLLKQLKQDINIPTKNIVPIDLDKARVYFVPLGTNIGAVRIEQGIGAKLDITVLGHNGKLDVGASFKDMGLTCKGSMDPLHLGALHIEGIDGSERPEFDYQLNLKNQHAILKGNLYIGDKKNPVIQSKSDMDISPKGVSFSFNNQFGPFEACVAGGTEKVKGAPDDFELTIDFQQSLLSSISDAMQKVGKAIANFFKSWQSSREKFTYKIDKQKQSIVEKKRSIRELEKQVSREIEDSVERKVDEVVSRKKEEIAQRKKEKEKKRKTGKPVKRQPGGVVSRF